MAQPATKRLPLGIDPFWDKLTPDPAPPSLGEMESIVQIGTSGQRKHHFRHATRA